MVAGVLGGLVIVSACSPVNAGTPDLVPDDAGIGPLWALQHQIRAILWPQFAPDATPQERQAHADQFNRAQQEYIAACMAEQGFTYIPFLGGGGTITITEDPATVARDTREFAELYGFGIGAEINDYGELWGFGSAQSADDPNIALTAQMSQGELAAWWDALQGQGRIVDGVLDLTVPGCRDAAYREYTPSDEFDALQQEIATFFQPFFAGTLPELAMLNQDWAACMLDAGFPDAQTPDLLQQGLQDEYRVITGWTFDIAGGGSWRSPADDHQTDPAQRAAFIEREVAAAVANYDCLEQVDFDQRHQQIDFALQNEFVNLHRSELEAWLEYAQQFDARRWQP